MAARAWENFAGGQPPAGLARAGHGIFLLAMGAGGCYVQGMSLRILLFSALWCGCFSETGRAEELDFGIYAAPARVFTRAEAASLPEHGKADVLAVLKARGFDLPEGSIAYYDAAAGQFFLRSTGRDLRRLQRIVQQVVAETGTAPKQVQLNAVCYAIPVSAVPPEFGPQSAISLLPQEQLLVVDRVALICRGGQKAKAELHREDPSTPKAGPDPGDALPLSGERSLEYEAIVSDDAGWIDINFAWEIRTERLAPSGQAATFKSYSQILAAPGSMVFQELGVTEEKEPRLVLLSLEFLLLPSPLTGQPDPAGESEK